MSKNCPKINYSSLYIEMDVLKLPKKSTHIWATFVRKICQQVLSKISQSGHTVQLIAVSSLRLYFIFFSLRRNFESMQTTIFTLKMLRCCIDSLRSPSLHSQHHPAIYSRRKECSHSVDFAQ